MNTRKILDIEAGDDRYVIPLHEFVRAIIYGDHQHYDPAASPVANLLEISTPDGREHFLLSLLLVHIERAGQVGRRQGFVEIDEIMSFGQNLGYLPSQVEFGLRHGVHKRLLQLAPQGADELARRYRITTVGVYTYRKLLPTFIYMDAVVVDTPIVDGDVEREIANCREVGDRLERARAFVAYLDDQWEAVGGDAKPFNWAETSVLLRNDFQRVARSAHRQSQPRRRRRRGRGASPSSSGSDPESG